MYTESSNIAFVNFLVVSDFFTTVTNDENKKIVTPQLEKKKRSSSFWFIFSIGIRSKITNKAIVFKLLESNK